MESDTKQLEIGNVLYEYGNYGIYNKVTVERVSTKTAFLSDGFKCHRQGWNGKNEYFSKLGVSAASSGLSHYRVENEDMILQWFRKQALEKLKSYPFKELSNEKLTEIIKILP